MNELVEKQLIDFYRFRSCLKDQWVKFMLVNVDPELYESKGH